MLNLIPGDQTKSAPDFTGVDAAGQNVTLSRYQGQSNVVLVLNRGFQ
jgi:peroxiredoxin